MGYLVAMFPDSWLADCVLNLQDIKVDTADVDSKEVQVQMSMYIRVSQMH